MTIRKLGSTVFEFSSQHNGGVNVIRVSIIHQNALKVIQHYSFSLVEAAAGLGGRYKSNERHEQRFPSRTLFYDNIISVVHFTCHQYDLYEHRISVFAMSRRVQRLFIHDIMGGLTFLLSS